MKEISKTLEYKGKTYKLVFNLNVMEVIQDKYGTLDNWGKLTDGTENDDEPNAKAALIKKFAAQAIPPATNTVEIPEETDEEENEEPESTFVNNLLKILEVN